MVRRGCVVPVNVMRQCTANSVITLYLVDSKMERHIFYLLTGLVSHQLLSGPLHGQDVSSFAVTVGQDSFVAIGSQISKRIDGQWTTVAEFTIPTVSLLLQYRPHVRSHFGFDEQTENFIDIVQDVSSTISTACEAEGRIWVGFSFYEGEGSEGYGGIGFYDPTTNKIGVLRHPALIDYSVKSMLITDTALYIQTAGHYELSSTVGNGLVIVDRNTLLAKAITPPGTPTLWDKDDPASADSFYNRPISVILNDDRFMQQEVPQFPYEILRDFKNIGLDSLMVRSARAEAAVRERAVLNARLKGRDVLTMPTQDAGWTPYGTQTGVSISAGRFDCQVNGVAFFGMWVPSHGAFFIRPNKAYPSLMHSDKNYVVATKGQVFTRDEFRLQWRITIDKLETKTESCVISGEPTDVEFFNSIIVRVELRELQE